jgi:DNA-binding LytR/AlgR family response regulator
MTVSDLHEILMDNGGFISVGRAYIINLRCVKNINATEVHLYHNISIPIPRGKQSEIKKAFWDFQCDEQGG